MADMAELRCEHVAKSYGDRTVLSDVALVVAQGTLTAILGASGSGKTTLLRVILGLIRADQGRVLVGGVVVAEAGRSHLAPEKRGVGYVAQEGALYPHLSVGENISFGLPRAVRRSGARVGEMLELVGLSEGYAGRRPHELSGGEQRRVALARALAPRPRVVLLDEPFSSLDAALRVETRAAVVRALAERETTAVLVTHDQMEALSTGHQVAVLRTGRLVQTGAPATIYQTPADLDLAHFVGDAVVLSGDARAGVVSCPLGGLPVLNTEVEGRVSVMVRPEQIFVRAGSGVAATVTGRTYYGSSTLVKLDLPGGPADAVTATVFSHEAPEVGASIELAVSGPVVVYPRSADAAR
jgi:iron(III) transport system ATP-binding protein